MSGTRATAASELHVRRCIHARTRTILLACLHATHAAARTRLRKVLAAQDAASHGGGAAGGGGAPGTSAERSPHAKTSYDTSEFDALADCYEALKWRMISKPGGATVKPDDFYKCVRRRAIMHAPHPRIACSDMHQQPKPALRCCCRSRQALCAKHAGYGWRQHQRAANVGGEGRPGL